jgi:hypothetical protein
MTDKFDLTNLFESVTEQLAQKKETLNAADSYNHNHGDHMVQIFNMVQNAVNEKSGEPIAEQLRYASKVVEQNANSGSASLYAQGFSKAAENMRGKDLSPDGINSLLTGLLSAEKPIETTQASQKKGLFGSLLAGFFGKQQPSQTDDGIGLNNLIQGAIAFSQSMKDGEGSTQAAVEALMAASPMGQSDHRKESGSIVAQTIMDFVKSRNK